MLLTGQNGQLTMVFDVTGDTTLLLTKDDAPPVLEEHASGASPFLLTADHYGRTIPRALGDLGLPERELTRHIAWDIGIAGVASALSRHLNAHLIAARDRLQSSAAIAELNPAHQ
jgi:predicted N-formylglutamate amidohydrolase